MQYLNLKNYASNKDHAFMLKEKLESNSITTQFVLGEQEKVENPGEPEGDDENKAITHK